MEDRGTDTPWRSSRHSESAQSCETFLNSAVTSDGEVSLEAAIVGVSHLLAEVENLNCHGLLSSWQEIIELENVVADTKKAVLTRMSGSSSCGPNAKAATSPPTMSYSGVDAVYSEEYYNDAFHSDMMNVAWYPVEEYQTRLASVTEGQDWDHRFKTRQKQIDIGKATSAYKTYSESVPRHLRNKDDPHTPRVTDQEKSKRSWKYEVELWRHKLRQYEAMQNGTVKV